MQMTIIQKTKILFLGGCLGLILTGYSQQLTGHPVAANTELNAADLSSPGSAESFNTSKPNIKEQASALDIPMRSYSRMKDVSKGYYLIVGVFKESGNLKRLIRKLNRKGLDAGSVVNPENGFNYVYAQRLDSGTEAISAASSQLNGRYTKAIWILEIENDPVVAKIPATPVAADRATAVSAPVLNSEKDVLPTAQSPQGSLRNKSREEETAPTQLFKKANNYFDRMWYKEAAELYETALSRNPEYSSPAMMEKIADAHYFNGNMERAHFWYEQLYDLREDELSLDYLFKYAQSLKGLGKYGRARRILKLHDKKLNETPLWRYRREELERRETTLDNLLQGTEKFGVSNLNINSKYSEFSPMFYGEDQLVFASSMDSSFLNTRRYKWNDQPYLDLYVAKMNEESEELRSAVKFSKTINSKYHEAAVAFSPDHMTMYFTRNNYGKKLKRDRNGVNHLKIYRSRKIDGEWTEAEELPFNGENYSTGHPAISPDGKQLYFVSDMPGTIGETDIFVVDILGDGSYSPPKNLGPEINTEQKEMFPFVTEQNLYFSSNGRIGLGGLDIFQASFDPEKAIWEVVNLGKPINSKQDDFSFIIDEASQTGYYASNRRGGKGDDDLYSFERLIPEEVNENAVAGVITDLITGESLPEAMVELLDENNIRLKEVVSGSDGSFVFEDLTSNTKYKLRIVKEAYGAKEKSVKTLENEIVYTDIAMQKLDELITIDDGIRKLKTDMIYFDFDKFSIRQDAASELDELVAVMQEYPTMVIAIESHTDSRGPKAYNKYLSDKRAKASRDYLISQGIAAERIESAIGYGEERLLNSCDGSIRCTSEQHQLNRRSEFIVVKM